MGFLAGVVKEINRQEEIEIRSKEFMAELLERRKNNIIPQLMEREQRRRAKKAEISNRVATADGLGLSPKAASILEMSGQLQLQIERLKDLELKGKLNKDNLKTLSEYIVESAGEENAEAALNFVLQGDLSGNADMEVELSNALWAAQDPAQFELAMEDYFSSNMSEGSGPTITPVAFSNRGASIITPTERSSAQNTIAKSMANSLGLKLNYDPNGNFTSFQNDDDGSAQLILNNAFDLWEQAYKAPDEIGDPTSIINPIVENVGILQSKGFSLADIAQNPSFDTSMGGEDDTIGPVDPVVDVPEDRRGLGELTNPFDANLGGGVNSDG